MTSLTLLTFILAAVSTLVSAAPLTQADLNSTIWTPEHVLQMHEVILYGDDGRMEVVHESVYHRLLESQGVTMGRPETTITDPNSDIALPQAVKANDTSLTKRYNSCADNVISVQDGSQTFVDWDVQMSPVVIGSGAGGIDVCVSGGYSVSNSFSVGGGAGFLALKQTVEASVHIDYSKTWTTQTVVNVKATVPVGWSGCMITKPTVTRRHGREFWGCLGSMTPHGTWQADSHEEGSYAGVKWVGGAITMCAKKQYPLTRCEGAGHFI
ncbi:hypothetical protein WAI453_000905 [Rhynchosporium graminicola]|uniref:Uncharacterized protein n=1 Tax=Rhynchosporium graminicola TaxID=2792576 RepID=A0A1E1K5E5_9HELO|nr:uncharacterized protein RCO7_07794 [Rhynchosporium commune]